MKNLTFKIFVSIVLVLNCVLGLQAKTYMVSVGIADYPGTDHDLYKCANDARDVKDLYEANADVYSVLLTDSLATSKAVIRALNNTFANAEEDDIIVFFFSGHGYPGGFVAYTGYLDYKTIRKIMAKSKAKNKIIFADACHAGQIRTPKKAKPSKDSSKDDKESTVMLLLSSRGDETSREYSNLNNGLFTHYLLKGLRGAADKNKNNVVEALELFKYVNPGVAQYSQGQQHPTMWGKFPDELPVLRMGGEGYGNSNNNVVGNGNSPASQNGTTTVSDAKNDIIFVNDSTGFHIYHNSKDNK